MSKTFTCESFMQYFHFVALRLSIYVIVILLSRFFNNFYICFCSHLSDRMFWFWMSCGVYLSHLVFLVSNTLSCSSCYNHIFSFFLVYLSLSFPSFENLFFPKQHYSVLNLCFIFNFPLFFSSFHPLLIRPLLIYSPIIFWSFPLPILLHYPLFFSYHSFPSSPDHH